MSYSEDFPGPPQTSGAASGSLLARWWAHAIAALRFLLWLALPYGLDHLVYPEKHAKDLGDGGIITPSLQEKEETRKRQ